MVHFESGRKEFSDAVKIVFGAPSHPFGVIILACIPLCTTHHTSRFLIPSSPPPRPFPSSRSENVQDFSVRRRCLCRVYVGKGPISAGFCDPFSPILSIPMINEKFNKASYRCIVVMKISILVVYKALFICKLTQDIIDQIHFYLYLPKTLRCSSIVIVAVTVHTSKNSSTCFLKILLFILLTGKRLDLRRGLDHC